MPTYHLTLPRPHPWQARIKREARRFNCVPCGRRFGKTQLGIDLEAEPALRGLPVGWFAPSYKYLAEVWRDLTRLLKPVIRHQDKTERRVELVTGGVVDFWSLEDPDAGRSRKYARVVVDEAAKCRNLEAAWTEAIRPTLTDFKGDAWFLSTPKGRDFFWQTYCKGLDPLQPDWQTWSAGPMVGLPTTCNPHIDPAEVEAARTQLPDRVFRQEYLAEFLEDAAGVFRNVRQAVDAGRRAVEPAKPGLAYSNGTDLARVDDFTVNTSLAPGGRQVYFDRFNQISWERQFESIKRMGLAYKGDVWLDATAMGGDMAVERLRAMHVRIAPFVFTNASKNALIDHLAQGIEAGKLRLLDVPEQTNELLAFEYRLTPSRNVVMSAPEGGHDDTVMALALAYWGASNTRRLQFF